MISTEIRDNFVSRAKSVNLHTTRRLFSVLTNCNESKLKIHQIINVTGSFYLEKKKQQQHF